MVYLRKTIPFTAVILLRSTIDRMWEEYFYGLIQLKINLKSKKTLNVFCVGIVSSIVTCGPGHTVSYI